MKTLIVGDTHGSFGHLNKIAQKKQPDLILHVGDLGVWPGVHPPNVKCPLFFCEGNHEDFVMLEQGDTLGCVYRPRGSTLMLADGRNVLFMGGAMSIDKHLRTPGFDWFPEETIKSADMCGLPNQAVDIIISHTAPLEFDVEEEIYEEDPSRKYLSELLDYKPSLWFFGHWHKSLKGEHEGTQWQCLNIMGDTGGWTWLT